MNSVQKNRKKISQMTLGTVQLGLNYGIANEQGFVNVTIPGIMKILSRLKA